MRVESHEVDDDDYLNFEDFTELAEDYADQIFIDDLHNYESSDLPYGWDITDRIDWESFDYE